MNNNLKFIGGLLTGALIGAATGLLLAPASGRQTRKKMINESKRMTDQFVDSVSKKLDSVKDMYNKKLDTFAKSGKSSIDGVKDAIKA